jgi:hypothetical protein
MRIFGYMTGLVLGVLLMAGCSNTVDTAGIEIGNPELANNDSVPDSMQILAFKAGFSIDYSDLNPVEEKKNNCFASVHAIGKIGFEERASAY